MVKNPSQEKGHTTVCVLHIENPAAFHGFLSWIRTRDWIPLSRACTWISCLQVCVEAQQNCQSSSGPVGKKWDFNSQCQTSRGGDGEEKKEEKKQEKKEEKRDEKYEGKEKRKVGES